jgi:hypothetical protein
MVDFVDIRMTNRREKQHGLPNWVVSSLQNRFRPVSPKKKIEHRPHQPFSADTVRHPRYCTDRYLLNLANTARHKIWNY